MAYEAELNRHALGVFLLSLKIVTDVLNDYFHTVPEAAKGWLHLASIEMQGWRQDIDDVTLAEGDDAIVL